MLCLALTSAFANPAFDRLADSANLKGAQIGILIADAEGRTLYARNADTRLIPASNQKIVTCAFAMGMLGPEATIKTRIWKTDDGAVVDAPGDPMIDRARLVEAAKKLSLGPGSLVLAKEAFRVGPPPSWEWDDLPFRYAAPITAFSVDKASWELYSEKGALEQPEAAIGVKANHRRQTGPVDARYNPWIKQVDVDGVLPKERKKVGTFSLPEPDRTASSLLGGRFVPYGGPLPPKAPEVIIESVPIAKMIKECLEPSDNILAEHLFLLAAGAKEPLPLEPYAEAAAREREFYIKQVGLDENDLRPVDGSGLSRQNLVTPAALVKILKWADSQPWAAQFREALAQPGEGTLSSRLQSVPFTGKTGTINAVSSLSGIIFPGEARRLYVSIVFNSAIASSSALRALQDEIVRTALSIGRHEQSQASAIQKGDSAHARHWTADGRRVS